VSNYKTLSSEKYYVEKLEAEVKTFRRQQAGTSIKTFIAFASLTGVFAACGWAMYTTPDFVPQCIDYMRANGILSF